MILVVYFKFANFSLSCYSFLIIEYVVYLDYYNNLTDARDDPNP